MLKINKIRAVKRKPLKKIKVTSDMSPIINREEVAMNDLPIKIIEEWFYFDPCTFTYRFSGLKQEKTFKQFLEMLDYSVNDLKTAALEMAFNYGNGNYPKKYQELLNLKEYFSKFYEW